MKCPSAALLDLAAQVATQLTHPAAPFATAPHAFADGSAGLRFAQAPARLSDWLDAGRAHADKPFIHYYDNSHGQALPTAPQVWTYADFFARADSWRAWLRQEASLAAGQRVAILAANSPHWIAALAASSYADAVVAPLNSMNTARDSWLTLAELQPALLFCDAPRLAALQKLLQAEPALLQDWQPCPVLLLEDSATPVLASLAPSSHAANSPAAPLPYDAHKDANDDALIVYTSGSASRPKGAVFTHDAVCQALYNLEYIGAFAALSSPAALQKIMAAGLPPCLLSCVPYFHVSGLYAQVLSTLKNGRKLVLLPRWNPAQALALITRERVTTLSAAPTMVAQLMAQPDFGNPALTGSLSALGFGGSAVPPALQQAVAEKMPDTLCGTGFGMTETGGAGAGASGAVFMANMAASGIVSPIMQVRITDENGQALPTGEAGEICLRGPTLMHAYWQRPEESADALRGGWMHTGDWGYVDAQNYLYIPGRIKEVINRHGEKIAASEVEAALATHPAVREVAVIPLPDAQCLECVAAVVVLQHNPPDDSALQAAALQVELQEHARLLLPAYKVPSQWHISTQPLPRNAMHKVLKKDLAALFALDQA